MGNLCVGNSRALESASTARARRDYPTNESSSQARGTADVGRSQQGSSATRSQISAIFQEANDTAATRGQNLSSVKALQGGQLPLQFSQTHRHVSSGCESSKHVYDVHATSRQGVSLESSTVTSPRSVPAKYGMTDNMVFAFTNDEVFTMSSRILGEEDTEHEGACVGHTIGFLLNKLKDGHSVEECAPSPEDEGERPGSIALQKNYLVINKNMSEIFDENPNAPPLKASHEQAGLNIDATGHFDDLDSLKAFLHESPAEGDVAAYSVTAHFADKDDPTVGSSHTFAVVKEGENHQLFVFDSGIGLMRFQEDDAKQNVPLAGFVNENRDAAYHYDVFKVSAK